MTDAQKVKKLAAFLEEVSEESCRFDGEQPYPDVVSVVAGHLVVAGLDPGKEYAAPTLTVYRPETAVAWYEAALNYKKSRRKTGCEWSEALMETEPDADL
jgi:hypothetical protein